MISISRIYILFLLLFSLPDNTYGQWEYYGSPETGEVIDLAFTGSQVLVLATNPTSEEINIIVDNVPAGHNLLITITDLTGTPILIRMTDESSSHKVDLKDLPAGIYFITINKGSQVHKLIKL